MAEGGWFGNALTAASMHGFPDVVRMLKEYGADTSVIDGK